MASDKKCRILVVDDDDSLRELLEDLPAAMPEFDICTTNTAVGLADLIRAEDPSVLLLDISMPDISGDAALARLRELGFKTKIVIYTALPALAMEHWARKLGADDFISKPFDIHKLAEVLKRNCPP